uniref:5-hydroxyisourate hydrolase n=1 Tax=Rhodosorus marinus TaxID=101924 RepID=A0A7S0G3L5_9RHOD|mmetsp:Transcript_22343/g.32250  ORF Transcript_22343/g.32250 Transcript_22343/m.32250 type:complete len:114 (+) Transcript_22343:119-460(+)
MGSSPLTTHILDTSTGLPAEGVEVSLFRIADREVLAARARSDKDGRCPRLLSHGQPILGTYKIRFEVADFFAKSGSSCFYPYVEIVFNILDATQHYHVPLLISPFGYTTYRGS